MSYPTWTWDLALPKQCHSQRGCPAGAGLRC